MTQPQFPPLITEIIDGMEDRKAQGITVMDLRDIDNTICNFFVICEGTSNTQVNAIAEHVEETTRQNLREKPWHVEGKDTAQWVLLDYVDTVVHVFQKEIREYYDLEGLWGDAHTIALEAR